MNYCHLLNRGLSRHDISLYGNGRRRILHDRPDDSRLLKVETYAPAN